MTSGRRPVERIRLPWVPLREGELCATGGGGRYYRVEENIRPHRIFANRMTREYLMKGLMGDVQFRSGPYDTQEQAVEAAEKLERKFEDRPRIKR